MFFAFLIDSSYRLSSCQDASVPRSSIMRLAASLLNLFAPASITLLAFPDTQLRAALPQVAGFFVPL